MSSRHGGKQVVLLPRDTEGKSADVEAFTRLAAARFSVTLSTHFFIIIHINPVAGQSVTLKIMNSRTFQIISSNKRQRTITFKVFDKNGNMTAVFKTFNLDKETFHYYTEFASFGDWEAFLKTDEYYKL